MILGPSGQNIYPEEIEQLLNNTHYVAESLIVEREGRLHALIFPDQDAIQASHSKESIENLLKAEITNLNKRLPKYSQIADYTIQKVEFDKTPKRSIKRFLYK